MTNVVEVSNNLRYEGKIDVVRLAGELGISVYNDDSITGIFNEKSAYIKSENGSYSIYVNSNNSKQRQRFSIAHEIAHFELHKDALDQHGQIDREGESSLGVSEEREADELAAQILMPEDDIKTQLDSVQSNSPLTEKIIKSLCSRYDVSFYAMIVRLRSLGYYVPYVNHY